MSIPTPRFTASMIGMSPGAFGVYTVGRLLNTLFPITVFLIEQRLFNALALTTHNWVLWGLLASYVGVICLRMGALLMEAWGDVTFRYRINGVLQHNTLHHALYERAGAEPLPVSALEAINRLRDDVAEVADFPLWLPEVVGTTLAAGIAFAAMAAISRQRQHVGVRGVMLQQAQEALVGLGVAGCSVAV